MAKESADDLRKKAQEMLKKANEQEKKEQMETKMKLGQLLQNYLGKKITLEEFKAEVLVITGIVLILPEGGEVHRGSTK